MIYYNTALLLPKPFPPLSSWWSASPTTCAQSQPNNREQTKGGGRGGRIKGWLEGDRENHILAR